MQRFVIFLVSTSIACGDDDPPGATIEVAVTASDILSNNLLADMEVCVTRPSGFGCATTDANGLANLMAPAESEVLVSFEKTDYFRAVNMLSTGDTDTMIEADLPSATAVALTISQTPDMMTIAGKGQVIVLFSPSGPMINLSGITVSVAPGAPHPLYFNESMIPDADLTETTETALVAFANLDPGRYSVSFVHPTIACASVESGWTTAEPKTLDFAIEADTVTILQLLDCE
jgi:hypothetical protein